VNDGREILVAFQQALEARDIIPPRHLLGDGKLHRCDAVGRNGKGDAAYILFLDNIPAAPIPLVDRDEQEDPSEVSAADGRQKPDPKTSPAAPRAPPGRVLFDRETVLAKLAISDATLRRKMDQGVLPRPIEIGGGYCLRWYLDEIDAALVRLGRQRDHANAVERERAAQRQSPQDQTLRTA
jgi:predicted DNA-binding transcriptional regulator AlpA